MRDARCARPIGDGEGFDPGVDANSVEQASIEKKILEIKEDICYGASSVAGQRGRLLF
jgi:hypothetical protein